MKKEIDRLEEAGKSWIIEGFPRTRTQALALAKMDFIPDKVLMLEIDSGRIKEYVKDALIEKGLTTPQVLTEISDRACDEYYYHIEGVKDIFKGSNISVLDGNKAKGIVLEDIARTLRLKS